MMNVPENSGKLRSPEELADLLDKLMSEGSGHINVFSDDNGECLNVETVNSTDCGVKGACCQPTEEISDED